MSSFAGVVSFVSFIICSYTPYFHYRLIFLHRFWWGGLFRFFRSRLFLIWTLTVIAARTILFGRFWSSFLLFRSRFIIFIAWLIWRILLCLSGMLRSFLLCYFLCSWFIFLIATIVIWWLLFLSSLFHHSFLLDALLTRSSLLLSASINIFSQLWYCSACAALLMSVLAVLMNQMKSSLDFLKLVLLAAVWVDFIIFSTVSVLDRLLFPGQLLYM